MHYQRRPSWALPEAAVTSEHLFLNRRKVLAGMGLGAGLLALPGRGRAEAGVSPLEAAMNPAYADAGRELTSEELSSTYNNFYEFGSSKRISQEAQRLDVNGWTIKIGGMVEEEFEIGFEDLMGRMQMEERIVRHRCVEAWSMVVPWTGFPLSELVKIAKPLSSAKYIKMQTFLDPDVATEQRAAWWPWPYTEGLTMDEAMNELSFMVTGAYGKELHKQFGAPMRLHTPWKYGFKSIKSIDRIEFTDERPLSFWEELADAEYGFWANVNPEVDHPRWSQAEELPLGAEEKIPTLLYNGYAEQVADMYGNLPEEVGERFWR
ncbi:protein-methionine-sulfoxide reductase catalytic subunit MsrP [Roseobacter sp. HKCCA0434]|uniref:protein-methionine-sulfoxide reductase catalytic subunit MsrP n=1 Tax=Roseobacter sp. HKCCA0434 TaxID=3079297 RepID=UPI002905EFDF|nr:protein-methionine-sulfoxide reductase catalytic subunit MsrP [Roseobacter sp. HKCCA0434]